ncbi:DNA-binding LytR/AlgR family response regulator [Algoriphagus boseongensis]|uniref:DNA-binding LytR/AlgR family response regulator n=1 Tax=Algoriphagus boseongensis TaxID=1442587 RepID=A0A4R6T614_9BACT|nr:LytTR family DNA-binding domain-containing protein [Algoriphagus boseongensis]TDQ18568.1 DNA-binding LytR/AlgR family response regulator [Algoriphagus boseongensis]
MHFRTLIVENDDVSFSKIADLIQENRPNWEITQRLQSVKEIEDWIPEFNQFDLIFCQVELPDGNCFEISGWEEINTPVIFIAKDGLHALKAFDSNGLDFLIFPFEKSRFIRALEKVEHFNLGISFMKESSYKASNRTFVPKDYQKRFLTKIGNKFTFIPVKRIACFYSEDGMTFLVESETSQKYVVDYSLNELESELLNPEKFYRINRSVIINLDNLVEMKPFQNGRLALSLKAKTESGFIVAREKVNEFKSWINQ